MFNCLQAEQKVAIRKCKFLNKFSVINSVLCQVFVVGAKKELDHVARTFSYVSG